MGSFASFWVVLLLVAGESVSSDDDEEKFTVTDGTFTQCPNKKIKNLSRWLSQRSDVNVSLWLLNYTELERNVWCKEKKDAECRGVSHSITLGEVVSSLKDKKYKCVVLKNKKGEYKQGFTLIALRGAASHSNPAPEGSSLSLTCESWGLPEVHKWEWTRNSVIISGTSKYMNNANLNKLTIRSLEKSDGGTYRCRPVFQQIGIKHSVFLNHAVMISGSASTGPPVSTPTAGSSTSITKKTTAGGDQKTKYSTTYCLSVSPSNSTSNPSATDPYSDAVVKIVVPVVLIILVLLGIGAFCLIKRKRSQG
ncbi:uncharacterized protein LOC117964912 [Acipenser ruthenus]|uniref:uncharacterized protein LOC117964912 n=1 Tax=Acipenser ruthenus TaxID=7906 RepID=UPI0027428856|nr:uncharacterized protein LOC117964912 [Acipenser ruthenus]XP_058866984.1 uncharacterized protein LOC117964912 [Acipenser ruthenus]